MYEDDQKCRNQKNLLEEGDVMKFKVQMTLTEAQIKNMKLSLDKITPIYKTLDDDLTDEIDWIKFWSQMIFDTSCDFVWDRYYCDFHDKKILPKNLFYKLVRHVLNCRSKSRRINENSVQYCFVESKSTS